MEMKEIRLEQLLMAMPNAGKRAEKCSKDTNAI